jgi:hypothetical protein
VILLLAVPRGALVGPLLLIAIGAVGLALEFGSFHKWPLTRIPAFIFIVLGVVIAMSRHKKSEIDTGVQRCTTVLLPTHRRISGEAPRKLIMRAIFGLLALDFSQATYPGYARLWIDITCVMGRVELTLPKDWKVQAGRIELARRISFEGKLSSPELAPLYEQDDEVGKNVVVLNVQGWVGAVQVQRVDH